MKKESEALYLLAKLGRQRAEKLDGDLPIFERPTYADKLVSTGSQC